jgi:hypothetical protein
MLTPDRFSLYADTARHLRPSQIAGRVRRIVPVAALAAGTASGTVWAPLAAGLPAPPPPQGGPAAPPESDGVFRAVGLARAWPAPGFWTDAGDGLLYLFHVHGFSALEAADLEDPGAAQFWARVIEDWLRHNDAPALPAWHPFPLSGRLIAWAGALSRSAWQDDLQGRVVASMGRQLRVLRRSVEHDVGGNHVLRNATALVVAGHCLGEARAAAMGERLLAREVPRQMLADGGHEERSPSYQQEVLRDLEVACLVLERAGRGTPSWAGRVDDGRRWLGRLAGPDGGLPLFNDAWESPAIRGSAAAIDDLAASGYAVGRAGGEQIAVDVAPLCPPHLPAHAHADVLAFELWADGHRVICDPGAGAYTGADRDLFRSTRMHATVTVDGQDQCRFWGSFRAAGLPRVSDRTVRRAQNGWLVVTGEHDGYRRLSEPVRHHRTIAWHPAAGVVVVDRLLGRGRHDVVASLPLAPGLEGTGPFAASALGDGALERVAARYAPYVGTQRAAERLELRRAVGAGETFGLALLRDGRRATLDGGRVAVDGAAPLELEQLRNG